MQLFAPQRREVVVSDAAPAAEWELATLPADEIARLVSPAAPAGSGSFQRTAVTAAAKDTPPAESKPPAVEADPAAAAELARRAADGFLINGSVHNAASSPFAQLPAFGNYRRGQRPLYNGNLGLIAKTTTARPSRTFATRWTSN